VIALLILQPAINTTVDTTTAVSLGVLVVVLGASWRLSSLLARIEEKLSSALQQIALLANTPERLGRIEERLDTVERDVHDLWQITERRSQ
jgi:hypothetical protein